MSCLREITTALARLCSRSGRDTKGQVAVIFALAALPILAGVGAAVDFSIANGVKAQLQAALDSSVLAGAGDTSGNSITTATNFFNGEFAPKINVTGTQATFTVNNNGTFSGTAFTYVPTAIMGIANINSIKVTSNATASVASTGTAGMAYCIIALNKTAQKALGMSGSAGINAPNCFVQVNSSNSDAVDLSGSTTIKSGENCFVGKAQTYSGNAISPSPDVICYVFNDPFANMATPAVGACNYTNYHPANNSTLQPGVYCGGLNISSATVTFASGLYIIKDGLLIASGGSKMTGTGVTFLLTGAGAGVQTSGSSSWHLSAMTTGLLKGFVFFLDPRSTPASFSEISGTSELYFEGVIYLAHQMLKLSGGSNAYATSPFTAYIADTFDMSSSTTLNINSDVTKTSVPIPSAIASASTGGKLFLKY